MFLIHRRDVIEPVEIRHRLHVGFILDQLFGAAMEQADMRVHALDYLAVELQHQAQHAVRRRMLRAEIHREGAGRGSGFGHHAPRAEAAAFSATLALKRSQATIARSCRPSPIRSTPSWARTRKLARRPCTPVHSASTVTFSPAGVAARWLTSTWVPRLPSPASRCGVSSWMQVHSISPTK